MNKENKPIPKWKLDRQLQITQRTTFVLCMVFALCFGFATGSCSYYHFDDKYTEMNTESERFDVVDNDELYGGFLSTDLEDSSEVIVSVEDVPVTEITEPIVEEIEVDENELFTPYSDYELYLLSHLVYGEGGCLSETCMRYIGSVALNRVISDMYPNDLHSVIYQKRQYACTWDGNFDQEPSELAIQVAKDCLMKYYETGSTFLPSNVLGQAMFVCDGWHEYCRVDGEIFSYP